jgi:hypothetical protein
MYAFAVKDDAGVFHTIFVGSMEDGVNYMCERFPEVPDDFDVEITEIGMVN